MRSILSFLDSAPFAGLLLIGLIVGGIAWSGERQAVTEEDRTKADSRQAESFAGGDAKRGAALYRQNCASCHRTDQRGRCMAPSLLGVTRRMSDEEIVAHAREIGEMMCCARHIGKITDEEFADVVAFLHAVDGDAKLRRGIERSGGRGCCCSR